MGCFHEGWPTSLWGHSRLFLKSCDNQQIPPDWKKQMSPLSSGREEGLLGNYRPASFTLIPEKLMEQLILKIISKHIKDKKVTRNSQAQMYKSHLTKLITSQTNQQSGGQWGDLEAGWPSGSNTCHPWHETQSPVVCTRNSYWGQHCLKILLMIYKSDDSLISFSYCKEKMVMEPVFYFQLQKSPRSFTGSKIELHISN